MNLIWNKKYESKLWLSNVLLLFFSFNYSNELDLQKFLNFLEWQTNLIKKTNHHMMHNYLITNY